MALFFFGFLVLASGFLFVSLSGVFLKHWRDVDHPLRSVVLWLTTCVLLFTATAFEWGAMRLIQEFGAMPVYAQPQWLALSVMSLAVLAVLAGIRAVMIRNPATTQRLAFVTACWACFCVGYAL